MRISGFHRIKRQLALRTSEDVIMANVQAEFQMTQHHICSFFRAHP